METVFMITFPCLAQNQENYLARLRGEDTIDNLREDLDERFFKTRIYEQILHSHGLLKEAEIKIKNSKEEALKKEKQFKEWRSAHPEVELPFD